MRTLVLLNILIMIMSGLLWVFMAFGLAFADKPLSMWSVGDYLSYAYGWLVVIALIPVTLSSIYASIWAYRKGSDHASLIASAPLFFWGAFLFLALVEFLIT